MGRIILLLKKVLISFIFSILEKFYMCI